MTHATNFLQVQACERCCGALYILTESPMVTAFEDGKARYYHYNCYQHSPPPALQEETPEHVKHCPYRHSGASCTCGGDPLNSDVGYLNTSGESLITPESAEEQAREMLYRAGVDIDIRMTSGDLVEIANLIAERTRLVEALAEQAQWLEAYRGSRDMWLSAHSAMKIKVAKLEQQLAQSRTEIVKWKESKFSLEGIPTDDQGNPQ